MNIVNAHRQILEPEIAVLIGVDDHDLTALQAADLGADDNFLLHGIIHSACDELAGDVAIVMEKNKCVCNCEMNIKK